jgi:hypothetical protein
MSAWLVSETHIRALVAAMIEAQRVYNRFAYPPAEIIERHPEAFAGLIRAQAQGLGLPVKTEADEIGRALWLANALALRARYPDDPDHDATESDVLAYRHNGAKHAMPPGALIKQSECWAYQCAEDNAAARNWARAVADELRDWAITELADYKAAPYGLDD